MCFVLLAPSPFLQLIIALQVDAFRSQLEVGLPEFDAGVAACLDGAHDLVIGRAAIEAEARIVVVEAVKNNGAVAVGERRGQLA